MSETSDIVTPTLEALKLMGVIAWRVNAGGRTRRSVQAPPGTPDIIGALPPNGRLFGLEAKAGKGKLSEAQEAWHERARKAGVLVGTIRSWKEAVELVEDWKDGEVAMSRMTPEERNSCLVSALRMTAEPAPTQSRMAASRAGTATRKTNGKASRNMEVGNG